MSLVTPVAAQEDDPAPPPVKFVSKDERARLDGETELRTKTKLAVNMLNVSIDTAEKLSTTEDFDGMFRELGHFRGLLEYTLRFLQQQDAKLDKTLDSYKRLEIFLRGVAIQLETIRRELPLRYDDYVRELAVFVRDARRKALEPLFGDTVVPAEVKNEK